jgi:hypothetical protein
MRRRAALMMLVVGLHWFSMSVSASEAQSVPQEQAVVARACDAEMPRNIWIDESMVPLVRQLLERSPTFRRQWDEIVASDRVSVAVRLWAKLSWTTRARAEIRHYGNGAIRAVIDVPVTREAPELVAHEFEHVVEQMHGLDLASMAREGRRGVIEAGEGAYETERAIQAGRAASDEYFGWARQVPRAATTGGPRPLAAVSAAAVPGVRR